jgi:type II secretion system protein G
MIKRHQFSASGFTLVEMAVVLVIVGLLLGGLLMPLSAQMDHSRLSEARRDLSEIKEALIGYALVNGRLPCPDTDDNGTDDGCLNTNANATSAGNLPWVELGVQGTDPWGRRYQYRINNAFSATFTLATTGNTTGVIRVCTDNTCATTEVNNVPAVIYTSGKNGSAQPPAGADELENTVLTANPKFDRTFVSHEFTAPGAANGEFDDVVVWVSPNILFNRMVAAGKLP